MKLGDPVVFIRPNDLEIIGFVDRWSTLTATMRASCFKRGGVEIAVDGNSCSLLSFIPSA